MSQEQRVEEFRQERAARTIGREWKAAKAEKYKQEQEEQRSKRNPEYDVDENARPQEFENLKASQYQRYQELFESSQAKFKESYAQIQSDDKVTGERRIQKIYRLLTKLEAEDRATVPCPDQLVDEALKARFAALTNKAKSFFRSEVNEMKQDISDELKALSFTRKMERAESRQPQRIEDDFETFTAFSDEFEILASSPEMQEYYRVLTEAKKASATAHAALEWAKRTETSAAKKVSDAEKKIKAMQAQLAEIVKNGYAPPTGGRKTRGSILSAENMERDIAVMKKMLAPLEEKLQKAKAELAEKQAEAAAADKNVRIAQNPFIRARIAELEKEQSNEGVCEKTSATTEEDCESDKRCEWAPYRVNDNRMFPTFVHHALDSSHCVDIKGERIKELKAMIMPEPVVVPTPPTQPSVVPTPAQAPPSVKPSTPDDTPDEPEEESSSMQNGVALVFAVIVLFGMF